MDFFEHGGRNGKNIRYDFSANINPLGLPEGVLEALRESLCQAVRYPEAESLSLREAIAGEWGTDAGGVVCTNGASELIYAAVRALRPAAGLLPAPTFSEYERAFLSVGCPVRYYPLKRENGFALDEDFLDFLEKQETGSLLFLCNPNNPTGYLYTQREMNQIRDLVKKYDLFLFSDEVYREFCYTGAPYISAFHLEGIEEQVVLIDSVSKRYSECGIRIGALITRHKELKKSVMKFCQARLSPPLLGQIVAEASIDAPESYMLSTYNEYVERRKHLIDGLNRIPGCYSPIPMGAFYTVARLPVDNADKFCEWCLSEFEYEGQTIFMAPASGFYTTPGLGKNEVRLAYVLEKEELSKALIVLQKALETYPGRTINE